MYSTHKKRDYFLFSFKILQGVPVPVYMSVNL
jgi:hypothetical protein